METTQNANSTNRRAWAPKLAFYHPNQSGNGAAVEIEVSPATRDRDGQVYLSIAPQNPSPENVVVTPTGKQCAAFFWKNRICVKLSFQEVVEVIMVLSGKAQTILHAGKEGFFHASNEANTTVRLKQSEDSNHAGAVFLGISKVLKANPDSKQSLCFNFSPAETFGLRLALEHSMAALAFGVFSLQPFAPRKEVPSQADIVPIDDPF